jgi:fermentation-respiration switch protein FrsA (DUF1100 family)
MLDKATDWLLWMAKYTVYTTCFLGFGFVVGIYMYQTSMIYPSSFPEGSRKHVMKPDEFGLAYENVTLVTSDNVRLTAYLIMSRSPKPITIVYFHSNAGNMGHRLPIAQVLYNKLNANVLLLSYRGYGLSEGSANEKGIKLDVQAAVEYVKSHNVLRTTKIVAYGQSIGGAAAIYAASAYKMDALIVENTFLSLVDELTSRN